MRRGIVVTPSSPSLEALLAPPTGPPEKMPTGDEFRAKVREIAYDQMREKMHELARESDYPPPSDFIEGNDRLAQMSRMNNKDFIKVREAQLTFLLMK